MSNEEVMQAIDKAIQKAALDGALTEDAIEQFHGIIAENGELRALRKSQTQEIVKLKDVLEKVQQERDDARQVRDVLIAKEQDMNEKLAQHEVLEMSLKYEQKRVDDHKSMVGLIFRNAVIKKGVMTAIDAAEPNQYNSCPSGGYAQKDEVEEEVV